MSILIALYARVSSGKQAKEHTIESQLAELRERIKKDGFLISKELEFIDEGYSGSKLARPSLKKLRDRIDSGEINKLYVHSPDRLARNYAYQVLLIEEFKRKNVDVIFFNHALDDNPESKLLLQMQGMIAEYERTKIMERSRRGKLHAAKRGSLNVLGSAPYGYRYIKKQEGNGEASWEIDAHEAKIVHQLFEWIGNERISVGQACLRLEQMGELTRKGKTHWNKEVVCGMLKNSSYKGVAAFGKTKMGEPMPRNRPPKHSKGQFRTNFSVYPVEKENWIELQVPAIIDEDLFELVQAQLEHNLKKKRELERLDKVIYCKAC